MATLKFFTYCATHGGRSNGNWPCDNAKDHSSLLSEQADILDRFDLCQTVMGAGKHLNSDETPSSATLARTLRRPAKSHRRHPLKT